VVDVASPQLKNWIEGEESGKQVRRLLALHVHLPDDFRLEAQVQESDRERALDVDRKLRRRHDDLRGQSNASS
ncbi:MAG: hypothetical protein KDB53_14080, partial [Planctomycetes bacterium]|nr:hypothetical protein [Planctomycetota bacterium]